MIRLVRLDRSQLDGLRRYAREFEGEGESDLGLAASDPDAYLAQVERLSRRPEAPGEHVQTFEYLVLDGDQLVASCRIRPILSEETEREGGHIAFEVRPSARGRGYGVTALQLALVEAARFDLRRILLTTSVDNEPAMRVLERHDACVLDLAVSPRSGDTVVRWGIRLGGKGLNEYGEASREEAGWSDGVDAFDVPTEERDRGSLAVLYARLSPLAVVLRRGPSGRIRCVLWDRSTDAFEDGESLEGRIVLPDSGLSPDGRHLLVAVEGGDSDRTSGGRWTAISRPPSFSALALVPGARGGQFLDRSRYVVYEARGRRDVIGADSKLERVDLDADAERGAAPPATLRTELWPHNYGTRAGVLFRRLPGGATAPIRDFASMESEPHPAAGAHPG